MTDTLTVSFTALKRISARAAEDANAAAEAAEVTVAGLLRPMRIIRKLTEIGKALRLSPRKWRAAGRGDVVAIGRASRGRRNPNLMRKTGGR